jgi:hypothetical protein
MYILTRAYVEAEVNTGENRHVGAREYDQKYFVIRLAFLVSILNFENKCVSCVFF